jgi:hypothetical protein
MYVRLAFAVAAHLEPEILLVDEVLAVGDINFQKKCLGKMGDVARAGRTVVLVSHQLNQIRRLCHRVVWVDDGQMRQDGPTHEVVAAYESAMARGERNGEEPSRNVSGRGRFLKWEIAEPKGGDSHTLTKLNSTTVDFTVQLNEPLHNGHHGIALYDHDHQLVWARSVSGIQLPPGTHHLLHSFPMLPVRPGPYTWLVSLYSDGLEVDSWSSSPEMIVATDSYQHQDDRWNGILNVPSEFQIDEKACRE